jgi:ABC-type branched-subunit amino acid transport system ATPase component
VLTIYPLGRNGHLTQVTETLNFTASCRLPRGVDKKEAVSNILRFMNLEEWKDFVVGRELEGEGLPKHARKRLTIAIQLVIQPKILFLVRTLGGDVPSLSSSYILTPIHSRTNPQLD